MADFDVSFDSKNFDINLLFSEENIDIIRNQFQSDIIEPLFKKYKNFSDKVIKEIDRKTENKAEFNKHVDFIGIDQISKTRSKIKNDIINPFLSKLESFYDNLGKTLDENKNINFLPKLDFSNINEKLEKKINDFENKIDEKGLEENTNLKKRKEKLKARSSISVDKIPEEIENNLNTVYVKTIPEEINSNDKDDSDLKNSSNILEFMSEFIQNMTILIEENSLSRIVLENIKNDVFYIKTFTTDFFPYLDKILDDKIKNISGEFLKQSIPSVGDLGSEQKKIGDQIPEISLSDDTIKKFGIMFNNLLDSDKFKDFFKKFDFSELIEKLNPVKPKEEEDSLIMKILKAALGLGLLLTLVPFLWDNYLKPWLEDFTGVALKKFDEILGRFEKPYETLEKWLVQSGLNVVAKTFTGLANLIDNTIGLITKSASFIVDVVKGAGSALKSIANVSKEAVEKGAIAAGSSVAGKVATEAAESAVEKGAIAAGSSVAGKVATEAAESAVEKGAVSAGTSMAGKLATEVAEESIEKGAVSVASTAAKSSGLLSKLGGKIFGKLSPRALSMIPVIGSIFNFGFAWDDYEKGDYTSMGINLVSGLVNLVPGVGWVASLGLDVFNAILGATTEGSTQEEININKSNKFKEWLKLDKLSEFIKNIPFIGWITSLGEGLDAAIAGDWETFFNKMDRVPQIGMITAPFKAFFDSTNVIDSVTGEKKSFSLETFTKELRKRMTRIYLSLIPSTFGMRSWVAEKLGVSEFLEENDVDASPDYSTETIGTDLQKAQNKAIENSTKPLDPTKVKYNPETEKKLSEEYEKIKEYLKQNEETLKQLQQDPYKKDEIKSQKENIDNITTNLIMIGNRLNEYRKLKENPPVTESSKFADIPDKKESKVSNETTSTSTNKTKKPIDRRQKARDAKKASKIQKADDFFESPMESFTNLQKYYYNPETDTKTYLNQNDAVYALQKGGIIEENINKQLEKFSETMMATLKEIQASGALMEKIPSIINAPVNNIMSSNVNNSNQDIGTITSGKRDPIFDARMDWWKISSLERVV